MMNREENNHQPSHHHDSINLGVYMLSLEVYILKGITRPPPPPTALEFWFIFHLVEVAGTGLMWSEHGVNNDATTILHKLWQKYTL